MQSLSNPAFISPQILLPIIFIPLILASFFACFIYKSIKSGILRRQKKILVKIVHDVTQVYYELDEHPLLLREYWVKGDNGKEGLYSTQGWDWKMKALKRRFLSSLLSEQDSKILGEFYSRLMVRDSIVIRYQDNLHKHIINFDNVIGEKELLTRTIKLKMIEKIDRNRDSYFYNYNFISINEKIKEKEYIFCLMLIIYEL